MKLPARGDALLPVDKPAGPTSHDIVTTARRSLGTRRIGHTGTLDPFASGLLLLLLNRATRLAEFLSVHPKEYVAVARLGTETTTLDVEGEVVRSSEDWGGLDEEDVRGALQRLSDQQEQVPPAFSAKKLGGERAYARARKGEAVTLEPVPIEVHEVEFLELDLPLVRFRVLVSTGTYVRAFARDLGEVLGVGAHLRELRRTAIGQFRVEGALSPTELGDPRAIERAWVPPLDAVSHLPRVSVTESDAARIQSGQAIPCPPALLEEQGPLAVVLEGTLLAIAARQDDRIRPRKVFPK